MEKSRLARKLAANKRQYIPIQQFCEGRLRLFMTQLPPIGDIHDWNSPCGHLQPEFSCRLLAERDFARLTDPREARCTLPELILLCEWFLDDYLGPYFRSLYEPAQSNDHSNKRETSGAQRKTILRASLEETLEMDPDYKKILEDLEESARGWKWGNTPFNWFKHIEIQAHRSIRALVKARIPCGSCNYYRHLDGLCVHRGVRKHQTGRGCSSYKPMVVDSGNFIRPDNSTIVDKISWRIIALLARAAEDAIHKPRQVKKLERLHQTVLEWQRQGMRKDATRNQAAQRYRVSPKTIDRDRQDLVKLLTKFRETDPELKRLFGQLEMYEEISS